ncbi:hypothetical protein [Phenylobacterium sp.]|uniref:hypothetical protein n=1 Tax=Phenylobacterium sp. TaxID=1871053 RepID=UPI003562EBC9
MTEAPREDIATAIRDPHLLGAALGDLAPWSTWLVVLQAAFALGLNRTERRLFAKVAGERRPPARRVAELWAVIGRRAGKTRTAAAIAAFIAGFVDHSGHLAPGEVGVVAVIAASKQQAASVLNYVLGFLEASPALSGLIVGSTTDEVRLVGNIVIRVSTNSFRTVRGSTLLAAIFDEVAYWADETSANPDLEVYRAVLPAMATTGGMLIGISSPYRKTGLLHAKHRDHFGVDLHDILVVQGATETFNPSIDRQVIARARANDPSAAVAEWDGEFREDISSLLSDEVIDDAIDLERPLELPPEAHLTYRAFTDASAGRADAFTLCIGHRQDDRFVADVVRGRKAPFNPGEVAAEFADLAKTYRCARVDGDNYAGEWTAQAFRAAGLEYRRSDLPKSGLYLEGVSRFMRRGVSLPNHPVLIREIRLLERRTSRQGKDAVDHPTGAGQHDDYANAVFGCMRSVFPRREPLEIILPIEGCELIAQAEFDDEWATEDPRELEAGACWG